MKHDLRIVFMGTPDFAVGSLDALVKDGFDVVGVITAVDKPAGRGKQLKQSAVKQYAAEHNIPVLQPKNLKNPKFQVKLDALQANLYVVVAFRMLPEVVFSRPALGTFNLHASLLPDYRGAAPINWAIINGEKETGITTFFIEQQIDTGEILLQEKVAIPEHYTAGDLHDVLMLEGGELVVATCEMIANGKAHPKPQPTTEVEKHAPKIFREHCEIDFDRPSEDVYNFIRGLSPYPGAWTTLENKTFKVFKAKYEEFAHDWETGEMITDGKTALSFATRDGVILCEEVQLEGKRRMVIEEFLRGQQFAD